MEDTHEHLHKIEIILAKQEENLRESMRRSTALETQIEQIRKQMLMWAVAIAGGLGLQMFQMLMRKV